MIDQASLRIVRRDLLELQFDESKGTPLIAKERNRTLRS